ncbi:hypothetical protein RND71_036684 [Anisodus tanguticus]|uniref:Uncharacterized protein n=1 Tax=Anisodus tanguticus TaxID=243964 RepID=A0AAE1R1M2_9SOLA|nr:hypothetical protein RND71_036684 [Anisodus tanguticus]
MDRTWMVVRVDGSPKVPSSEISGEEDQVGPCEQLDVLSSFNPLSEIRQKKRKENPWTDPIISNPPVTSEEGVPHHKGVAVTRVGRQFTKNIGLKS